MEIASLMSITNMRQVSKGKLVQINGLEKLKNHSSGHLRVKTVFMIFLEKWTSDGCDSFHRARLNRVSSWTKSEGYVAKVDCDH